MDEIDDVEAEKKLKIEKENQEDDARRERMQQIIQVKMEHPEIE